MAEFVEMILAQLIGNISTALILALCYFNFLLFENYLRLIVWAFLVSQALRQAKTNIVSILEYLSDDPDVDRYGFLNSIFSKCADIFITHAHDGSRRTPKELFLNYGTFVFLLIGAVSIWLRMFSLVSFLNALIGFWIVTFSLVKILDRRVFYYRYFISDEVLVSVLLILGFFFAATMVVLYLGTESYHEGSRAATDVSVWIQQNFVNDERTRKLWSEQLENSRVMISQAISGVEDNYNDTMWWPPIKTLVKTYYLDVKGDGGNLTAQSSLYSKLKLPENMTFVQAVSFAYAKVDSVNLTSVQLTDWTSKVLDLSTLAVGSVAQLVFLVITFLIAFVSLGIRAVFFISTLFYLLCIKWDPIERFLVDLLPIQVNKRPVVLRSLRKVVEGVFFLPLKMSSIHAMVTMVSFTIVNADYMYLATTVTFFISIVPIIPPYLVCVPWVVAIGISSSLVKAAVLFAIQYVAFTVLDDMLYEKSIVAVNSYVSALSVVFGVYVFGFEGVIFGPLIVCGVSFAYDASNHGIQAAQDDHTRASGDVAVDGLDGSEREESRSRSSSSLEDDDQVKDDDLSSDQNDDRGLNSNIFSSAMYRVISAPLVDRVRRRLSIDVSMEDSICVTLVVDGLKSPSRKVRFVINKNWSQKVLHENIRRTLHAQAVDGIFTMDGAEVLSPLHIIADETLNVKARPKLRTQTYPTDGLSHADSHLRVVIPSFGSTGTRRRSGFSPSDSANGSPRTDRSSTVGKKNGGIAPIHGATASQRHLRDRIRRISTAPGSFDGRRHSLGATTQLTKEPSKEKMDLQTPRDKDLQHLAAESSVRGSRSHSSASTQENDSGSGDDAYSTPAKGKSSASEHEVASSEGQEADVSSGESDPSPMGQLPALGKRTHALKVSGGSQLMFSPLAVDKTSRLTYQEDTEVSPKLEDVHGGADGEASEHME